MKKLLGLERSEIRKINKKIKDKKLTEKIIQNLKNFDKKYEKRWTSQMLRIGAKFLNIGKMFIEKEKFKKKTSKEWMQKHRENLPEKDKKEKREKDAKAKQKTRLEEKRERKKFLNLWNSPHESVRAKSRACHQKFCERATIEHEEYLSSLECQHCEICRDTRIRKSTQKTVKMNEKEVKVCDRCYGKIKK